MHFNVCSFADCTRTVHNKKRQLCSAHYQQWHSGVELRPVTRRPRGTAGGACSFNGCKGIDHAHGLCIGHYQQLRAGKELTSLKRRGSEVDAEINSGVRTCTGCKETFSVENFHTAPSNRGGFSVWCKTCTKNNNLVRNYKMTLEQWNALFAKQGNRCAICRTDTFTGKGWVTDHDHSCCPRSTTCGKCVRAILCHDCNITVGYIENHPDIAAALDYVRINARPFAAIAD